MRTPVERITALSPEERRGLLAELLRKKADLPKRFPPSFSQQRLWFLDQLVPGNSFYNISAALRLRTALSAAVLERSLNEMVRRHEALRTVFPTNAAGEPMQQVLPELRLELAVADLRMLRQTEREAQALRLATEEARRPFDLARGPLLRAGLLQLGAADHVFLLTLHHIVADGWSLGIFARELTALYAAFAAGRASPLPELPIQYADFALWQRGWLQGEVLEAQLRYWTAQLKDLPVLQLPTDRRRPAVQTYQGASHPLVLPPSLVGALRQLGQREGVTLFMTLLAAFKVLLHRYSGQDDILTGVPVAGRNRAETEGLIGFFVNTLVMRTDLSGDPTFRTLLQRVRDVALGAYAHQDLPFEMLVEKLQPERDLSRNPLFQVTFQLLNVPGAPQDSAGAASGMEIRSDTAKFDLTFDLHEERAGEGETAVVGRIEHNTDLFDARTIERMANVYETLLGNIVSDPSERISKLRLLTAAERHRLVTEWNDTATPYPREALVHRLFEAQVENTPNAVAIDDGARRLSYVELNRRANQLARELRSMGVTTEALVAVCMERSLDLVVSFLGILKAGGAYVPLDPSYPKDRLDFMLADTRAPVILTHESLADRFRGAAVQILCLDASSSQIARHGSENVADRDASARNVGYVMYTSGSTGTPKGVCVPHRAIVRLVWNTNYVDLRADDVVAQASNASFDAATFEIWGALLHGASLAILSTESTLSPRELAAELPRRGVTTLFLTASLFNQIASEAPDTFRCLRHLLFGGEAGDLSWSRQVLTHGPPQRLTNGYGPTESTTFACAYTFDELPEGMATIPIGRPISNTRIYLLDRHLEPVPVGVPGELYIGGDGVARGYLNCPELTAARFVPDCFEGRPDAVMYRTGDLARYLPDGNIEFLGRLDHQVKIRGFRVELGEIETVLCEHPGVQEAVVTVSHDALGNRRLTAYVVAGEALSPGAMGLREYVRRKLPDYMVPSAFVSLESFPLTPNGKLDRHALPPPDDCYPGDSARYVAPSTDLERALASVWQQVLDTDKVSTHDNFFDLGGYSLLLMRVQRRLKEVLGRDIAITDLFKYPSIKSLACFLDQGDGHGPGFAQVHERVRRRKEAIERRDGSARMGPPR